MTQPRRIRDLGIPAGRLLPGPHDAVIDVAGVRARRTVRARRP